MARHGPQDIEGLVGPVGSASSRPHSSRALRSAATQAGGGGSVGAGFAQAGEQRSAGLVEPLCAVLDAVALNELAARKHVDARHGRCLRMAAQQQHLHARRGIAQQHHGGVNHGAFLGRRGGRAAWRLQGKGGVSHERYSYVSFCSVKCARSSPFRRVGDWIFTTTRWVHSMEIDFKGRVAIVTGAGGGLGRQHALALAKRGAKVLVNDLGGAVDGSGGSVSAAQAVVDEIRAAGGEALANGASVTDFEAVQAMVQQAVDAWGRVDILVNNAGILRDKSLPRWTWQIFAWWWTCTSWAQPTAARLWPHMVAQNYGRIVMTTSSTGLYGNFGQSNYGAAKLAQVGLMQTLAIEGAKYNIRVNALAPTAATRMTEALFPPQILDALKPEAVVPPCWCWRTKARPHAPSSAQAAVRSRRRTSRSRRACTSAWGRRPEQLAACLAEVTHRADEQVPQSGAAQGTI